MPVDKIIEKSIIKKYPTEIYEKYFILLSEKGLIFSLIALIKPTKVNTSKIRFPIIFTETNVIGKSRKSRIRILSL